MIPPTLCKTPKASILAPLQNTANVSKLRLRNPTVSNSSACIVEQSFSTTFPHDVSDMAAQIRSSFKDQSSGPGKRQPRWTLL
jgi:hypothetical protein